MNNLNNNPIGVFDSGVGGLTVAHAIKQIMPNESLIYFGDTAHLPYGDKSAESIIYYSRKITNFLLENNAKMVMIACNSASASAYSLLKEEFGDRLFLMDVIEPVVNYIASRNFSKVGVIGTKRTITSGTYEAGLKVSSPKTEVVSLATPLFVPMIEEGFIFDDISNAIIRTYLTNQVFDKIDALILGCTHYPIIKNQITKLFNFEVEVIDSARVVALELKSQLESRELLRNSGKVEDKFFVSDFTSSFDRIARMFFEAEITLEKSDIWT
jgi:glutamate racemase